MITCNWSLHHQARKPRTPPCNCNILNTHNSSNFPMAFIPHFSYIISPPNLAHNYYNYFNYNNFTFCRHILNNNRKSSNPSISLSFRSIKITKQSPFSSTITCSATNGSSDSEISSAAKIRSEVLSPFRTVRMFFYLAFIASGTLGGLIATTQLIAALNNSSRAAEVPEILKGLSIDVAAVSLFAFLYSRENNAKNAQLAKLSREESLSKLKLRVDDNKIISVNTLRGIARLVICAGPSSFITEAFKLSEPFTQGLLDRGVLVVPFSTDENLPSFEFDESEEMKEITSKRKRLWQLTAVYVSEWSKWLDEQKKLAGVSRESPVYLSLRLDGRVRGSGIGYPPWSAFVAQLPPVKGMWTGLLDGFDGRVL